MIVMAIDTSHPAGSVSIARDGTVIAGAEFGKHESHLREIGSAIDRLLADAGLTVNKIDRLALVSGPGSFTGLRIGMAFVKGLSAALGAGVVTIDSLELLALAADDEYSLLLPMIDARKDEVYAGLYAPTAPGAGPRRIEPLLPPGVAAPAPYLRALLDDPRIAGADAPFYCTGSGVVRYREVLKGVLGARAHIAGDTVHTPSTAILAERAHALIPLSTEALLELEPFYIRSSDAVFKRLKEVRSDG